MKQTNTTREMKTKLTAILALSISAALARAATPFSMASGDYSEDFNTVTNWADGFASPAEATRWSAVLRNPGVGIPNPTNVLVATTNFASTNIFITGVQRGSNPPSLILFATGATTDNTNSTAVDLLLDYSGCGPGTLSFNWAVVNNSTGDRASSLRVYAATNAFNFTELAGAAVLNRSNNMGGSGTISAVALPASFSNSPTARLRFYVYNGTGGSTGSRARIAIYTVAVTGARLLPTVATQLASGINDTVATLNGAVNPNGFATTYYFEYGLTTQYGSFTATNSLPATNASLKLSTFITGLTPGLDYHFRLWASNPVGTASGTDRSFRTGPLWDDNDFIVADGNGFVVLNEDFTFKTFQANDGSLYSAARVGSLDWFANGDLLVGSRDTYAGFWVLRYDRYGNQLQLSSYSSTATPTFPRDIKLSFNQNDILVSSLAGGSPIYQRRFALSPASALESSSFVSFGGVAVVTRTNGNHELWVAAEGDYGGIHIFPMTSAGQVQFTNGSVANANVPAASCTMTFDPATRRVLFGNMTDPKVYAMDVETHALVQTYTIPAGNGPGWAEFTGITTGSNGVVVAIEAWDNFSYSQPHRFGLSVWNADGSNYRFINLDGLAGYDMVETNSYISPINILWTGNAVQSRLANLTRANGSFGCDVTGVAGLNYVVQAATNLAAPIWEPITTNTAPFQFSDPASATLPARFYRAVRQ